jgi:hypothetical protein
MWVGFWARERVSEGEKKRRSRDLFVSKFGEEDIGTCRWIINFDQLQNDSLASVKEE